MKSMLLQSVTGRILFVLIFSFVFINAIYAQSPTTSIKVLYQESFETGMNGWSAQNGVWEAGIPTSGPSAVEYGEQVVGTILDGNYPDIANSRLVSRSLEIPAAPEGSTLRLSVSHWYSLSSGDFGEVQVSVDGGAWESLIPDVVAGISTSWQELFIPNLEAYSGMEIRLGFLFTSADASSSSGWYIDRVQILEVENTPSSSQSFENDAIGWLKGEQWEFGAPTSGPAAAFDGTSVAGTVLGGAYADGDTTRLISAPIQIPILAQNQQLKLRFWHWFSFGEGDNGTLSISEDGGAFEPIPATFKGESRVWTKFIVPDISDYASPGSEIRFAFDLNTTSSGGNGMGWYVDMIETTLVNEDSVAQNRVGNGISIDSLSFESSLLGAEWHTDNGIWEIGSPSSESGFSGSEIDLIAGTVLDGTYPNDASSRLISPPIQIDTTSFSIELTHSFSLSENDSAFIQIQVEDGDWINIAEPFSGTGGTDTEFIIEDAVKSAQNPALVDLENKAIRLGFLLVSQKNGSTNTGWYIANIGLAGPVPAIRVNNEELELPRTTVLHQNYPNPFNPTTTLSFELDQAGPVSLSIYDLLGRKVETLIEGTLGTGPHAYTWNATHASSGVYLYRLTTPSQTLTRQMILFR